MRRGEYENDKIASCFKSTERIEDEINAKFLSYRVFKRGFKLKILCNVEREIMIKILLRLRVKYFLNS
jgi:hypothetical protein